MICFILSDAVYSQTAQEVLQELKNDTALQSASWSFCAINCTTGKVILEHNSRLSLIPASSLKVVTTGAALGILKPNYTFKTEIKYDGTLDTLSGNLQGNIYIKGGGDPTLGSELFKNKPDTLSITNSWARQMKLQMIKKINGGIVADQSAYEEYGVPSSWIWGDMGNYYGSQACGLSFHENKYTVYMNSGSNTGDSTSIVSIKPKVPGLEIKNFVTSGGNDDNAYIYGEPYSFKRYMQGTIPAQKKNYEVEGSLPDPALFCAQSLNASLLQLGIELAQKPTTKRTKQNKISNAKTLLITESPALSEIVKITNLKSHNLFAEHLLKAIAYEKAGFGTEEKGIELVMNYWRSKGLNTQGMVMVDGCGLSRMNMISAYQLATILKIITAEPYYNVFTNSLPVAGRSGSLANIGKGTIAEGNLKAKSGYLTRARSYTGYVTNTKGETIAFAFIANNYTCSPSVMRKKMEQLMVTLPTTN